MPRRRCRLRTSPEYIKRDFLLLRRELVNISLGHEGSLQSPCFKRGQLSAAPGLAFCFPSSCYNSFRGFKNRCKKTHPAEEKAHQAGRGLRATASLSRVVALVSAQLHSSCTGVLGKKNINSISLREKNYLDALLSPAWV